MITFDPVLAQTVNLDLPYQVFLTPRGDCALYLVETTPETFTVAVVGGGAVDVPFDYRIVAKRRGYEGIGLAPARDPLLSLRSPEKEPPPERGVVVPADDSARRAFGSGANEVLGGGRGLRSGALPLRHTMAALLLLPAQVRVR